MDLGSAILGFLTAFVAKGLVMFWGFWLIYKIAVSLKNNSWINIDESNRLEIKTILIALVIFYIGEVACAVDTVLKINAIGNEIFDWIHSICAGVGSALVALGLYLGINKKLIFYGEKKCLLRRVCHECTFTPTPALQGKPFPPEGGGSNNVSAQRADSSFSPSLEGRGLGGGCKCNFNIIITLITIFIILTSLLPFFVPIERVDLDPLRSALPIDSWNNWYDETMVPWFYENVPEYETGGKAYYIPKSVFFVEFRVLAFFALIMSITSLFLALKRNTQLAMKYIALCGGLLGYIYFEISLYKGINDALISSFGHEVTEVWFLVFLKVYLGKVYRIKKEV